MHRRLSLLLLLAGCGGSTRSVDHSDSGPDSDVDADSDVDSDADTDDDTDVLPCEPTDGSGCPDGQKCTIVPTGLVNPPLQVACADEHGSLPLGAVNCLTAAPDHFDYCGPGLWCFGGREFDGLYCRQLCHDDADCLPSGGRCLVFVAGSPPTGMCARECTPFGTDCPDDASCHWVTLAADGESFWVRCGSSGDTAAGGACFDVYDECAADTYCWGGSCSALCDDDHPCASGACDPLAGLAAGGGLCR